MQFTIIEICKNYACNIYVQIDINIYNQKIVAKKQINTYINYCSQG